MSTTIALPILVEQFLLVFTSIVWQFCNNLGVLSNLVTVLTTIVDDFKDYYTNISAFFYMMTAFE